MWRNIVGLCIAGLLPASAAAQDLTARKWYNNPVFRLHDDRAVILFFFRTGERSSETLAIVKKLNRLASSGEIVVIGLTEDPPGQVERFIRKHRVRFTIGAGSKCSKKFAIEKLPATLYWARGIRNVPGNPDPTLLERLAPVKGPAPESLPPEVNSAWEIESFIESQAQASARQAAVKRLWEEFGKENPQDFLAFAESRLADEPDPWVRGELRYRSRLARGEPTSEADLNPSVKASHRYRASPDSPEWQSVRALEAVLPQLQAAQLLAEYERRTGDDDVNLLCRRLIIQRLGQLEDRPAARQALMQILPGESDASNRFHAAARLRDVCETGDEAAAALLDELARVEPHTLRTRPIMEATAEVIRTGRIASRPDSDPTPR